MLTISALVISVNAQYKKNTADSTKSNQQKIQQAPQPNYFIIGQMDAFKLLVMAITSPDDVTANERKRLLYWLNNNLLALPTDTTGNKK